MPTDILTPEQETALSVAAVEAIFPGASQIPVLGEALTGLSQIAVAAAEGLVNDAIDWLGKMIKGSDKRIGLTQQRVSDAADVAAGIPGRFKITLARKSKVKFISLPDFMLDTREEVERYEKAQNLYIVIGSIHMGTGSAMDIRYDKWMKKWWLRRGDELARAQKRLGMPSQGREWRKDYYLKMRWAMKARGTA